MGEAIDISKALKIVGIEIQIGRESAARVPGDRVGERLVGDLAALGVPAVYFCDLGEGSGVAVNFYIGGRPYIDPNVARDDPRRHDFNGRDAIQQIPHVAASFKRKYPDVTVNPGPSPSLGK